SPILLRNLMLLVPHPVHLTLHFPMVPPASAEHLSTSPSRPIRAPAEGPVEGSPRTAERLM
ncbi:hypothetical protein FOZ63_003641, partial [Perkinsus olseni]